MVTAKILGLLVVTATGVVAAEALFTVAALLAAQTRGTTAGLTSGAWTSHLLLVLPAIGAAAFAGVLGFAIAFGTRITAAAVAVGFIYFAVLAAADRRPGWAAARKSVPPDASTRAWPSPSRSTSEQEAADRANAGGCARR